MAQTSTVSRTQRRKALTEAAIIAAAEDLFLARGFGDTRMEDVAERADVAVGSIYTHFGSKLSLYLAVVDRALAQQEALFGTVHTSGAPADERLEALGDAYLEFTLASPARFRLLNDVAHIARIPDDDAAAPVVRDLADRGEALVRAFEDVIADGIAAGRFRAVDPHRSARFLWASWTGVLALHLRRDGLGAPTADELRAVIDAGVDIVRLGIARTGVP